MCADERARIPYIFERFSLAFPAKGEREAGFCRNPMKSIECQIFSCLGQGTKRNWKKAIRRRFYWLMPEKNLRKRRGPSVRKPA